jgi:hypothetical protein
MNGISLKYSLILASSLVVPLTLGAQQLTDITVFGAYSNGSYSSVDNWDTRTAMNNNVWIQSVSSGLFLNGPSDAAARPNISLSSGTSTFTLFGNPGANQNYFGINLFFDGAGTPSISVYAPMKTATGADVFYANSASVTAPPTSPSPYIPGAGTLSFVSGSERITVTDFYWATPSLLNLDLVGSTSIGADGVKDFVGGITLTVTQVPEPQVALWLAAISALGIGLRTRRHQKVC